MKQGWDYKKLDDVALIKGRIGYRGYTKNDLVPAGEGAITLSPANITDYKISYEKCQYISWFKYEESPEIMIYNGDIIYAKTASIGKVALVKDLPEKATINPQFVVLKEIKCDNSYLYYVLRSNHFKQAISLITNGVAIPTVSQSNMGNILIPIPPIEEQKAICSLLDNLNLVIEKKKEQIAELDNLSQSLFYDMFGDPTINEKGWEVKKMGDFGSFQRGLLLQKKDFVENGCPCIHYGQLHTSFGAYTTKHLTNISQELFSKSKIAHKGDLILALTSEDVEGSCKSTAWLGDYDIAVGSDAAIFSHNQDGIYLSFYTRTRAFYNEKDKYARGFKVTHIKTSDIATFPICLPPLPLQQAFAEKVKAIEQQKELINQSIKDVQTLFDAKMDYYFGD